ncbi:MAG: FAD-binding protein [Acetobacteraceae bacterium]|nr:FAD-binding protein [Acetobacteraceae bacterium]
MKRVHVIGAGLAGLSAAVALAQAGCKVRLYEAGPVAGGRCRSYYDRVLGCRVDNGNHLLLSGNRAAMGFLDIIGSRGSLIGPGVAAFPFMDVGSGERWVVRPNAGRLPWWIFSRARRVLGTSVGDYFLLLKLWRARGDVTVSDVVGDGVLFRRLLEPLAVAALNTPAGEGLAQVFAAVVWKTLGRGGAACVPWFPAVGMNETFIDPAVDWLRARGGEINFHHRVTALHVEGARVVGFDDVVVDDDAGVVLAVPAWAAGALLPELNVPKEFQAIVNVHFKLDAARAAGFTGVIGGKAEWIFVKQGHVSVTISAANRIVDEAAEDISAAVWADVRRVLDLPNEIPVWRVVKERRATFAATGAQERVRPGVLLGVENLALAGDWTATGLPGTIEGAVQSGRVAAEFLVCHGRGVAASMHSSQ